MTPTQSPAEARAHDTFTALMWALSRPGQVQTLESADPLVAVAEALLDLETTFFTPNMVLEGTCRSLGARFTVPERADYLLFPELNSAALSLLEGAAVGTLLYPDSSATLILGAKLEAGGLEAGGLEGAGVRLRLRGPGIPEEETLALGGPGPAFWALRERKVRFPLGWDVLLLEPHAGGSRVLGVPRSTRVEVL